MLMSLRGNLCLVYKHRPRLYIYISLAFSRSLNMLLAGLFIAACSTLQGNLGQGRCHGRS